MNIKIKSVTLCNFKCFKSKHFDFSSDIVTISGRNGAGKTTVADAIIWCLFGKNVAGQSDFDLKTHDEDGKVIPHLDHSVEMVLNCDHGFVTLKRTLKEVWVKKRASDEQVFKNNTTEYLVNGEVTTAADYKRYIASLVSEDIFRAITSPTYFTSLKWQEQRKFLEQLVGDQTTTVEGFEELISILSGYNDDIVKYRKHLSYQIRQIKEKLANIPIRLEEQNKALPEPLDWEELLLMEHGLNARLREIDNKIRNLQNGNGSMVKRDELRKQIEKINSQRDAIREQAYKEASNLQAERMKRIFDANNKFTEALNKQKEAEANIENCKLFIERFESCIKDCDKELQHLRDIWPVRKFEVNASVGFCPTCGQALPEQDRNKKIAEMRENFNRQLEAEKQSLRERAAEQKTIKEEAVRELENAKGVLEGTIESLQTIKESINNAFSEKQAANKEEVVTAEELLSDDPQYIELCGQVERLKEQMNSVTDDADEDAIAELNAKRAETCNSLTQCQQQLATKPQYDRITSLIEAIKGEERDLISQLSELERQEDIARQYQDTQNALIESRINEHFKITRWRLTRTVNNAGDPFEEPYCECYDLNGTAYHDGLNQAARLNIGLDIINTLCQHYGVSAPIVLDQAESTLDILPTTGQQIRLQVMNSELQLI